MCGRLVCGMVLDNRTYRLIRFDMAILKNGPALSGKVGSLKYSQVGGVTVVSELSDSFHDAKTHKQLVQRMKLNNILLTYRMLKDYLKENFEEVSGARRACHVFRGGQLGAARPCLGGISWR